jgi:hypothetical protein
VSDPNPPVIVRVADGCYLPPGAAFPLRVSDSEDLLLLVFVRRPACDLAELQDHSGLPHAARVLGRFAKKYKGAFAPAVSLPGGKGRGGYSVRVRNDGPPLSSKRPGFPAQRAT